MALLLLLMVAVSVMTGYTAIRMAELADYQPQYALEMETAAQDAKRTAVAYNAWNAGNLGNPWPTVGQVFPAYGFTPITYKTGRATLYRAGGDHMTYCYVPRGLDPVTLKAHLGPAASIGTAVSCPSAAGAAAGASAQAVFYQLNLPGA